VVPASPEVEASGEGVVASGLPPASLSSTFTVAPLQPKHTKSTIEPKARIRIPLRAPEARNRLIFVPEAVRIGRGPPRVPVLSRSLVGVATQLASANAVAVAPFEAAGADDGVLVARALRGERAAEEALYRRHADGVFRLALRLLRSNEDAMDVLQDAFVAAFEGLSDLREGAAFRSWIHGVAVHQVHRRFRRRKLLAFFGLGSRGDDVPLESLIDESATPEARAELRLLDAALGDIGEEERVAWMLRNVEEHGLEEVARLCRCSLATAKRRIAAADAAVRRHFKTAEEVS
jgi:RNA polymerase sigma-70 factor (ECF subfamily)